LRILPPGDGRLDALDAEVRAALEPIPADARGGAADAARPGGVLGPSIDPFMDDGLMLRALLAGVLV